jgi:hypothetical protein
MLRLTPAAVALTLPALPISVQDPDAASVFSQQWLTVTINLSTGGMQAIAE